MSHTILLLQPGERPQTRTYCDYECLNDCLEGICRIYEKQLKIHYPNSGKITYDVSSLMNFIDELHDITCLIHQQNTKTYAGFNRTWIKENLYIMLSQMAKI